MRIMPIKSNQQRRPSLCVVIRVPEIASSPLAKERATGNERVSAEFGAKLLGSLFHLSFLELIFMIVLTVRPRDGMIRRRDDNGEDMYAIDDHVIDADAVESFVCD